jgi:hypothetical protein
MVPARRQFLYLAAGTAALVAGSRVARAQSYPSRPVSIIVPVPARRCRRSDRTCTTVKLLDAAEMLARHGIIELDAGALARDFRRWV